MPGGLKRSLNSYLFVHDPNHSMTPMAGKSLNEALNGVRRLTEVLEMPSFLDSKLLNNESSSGLDTNQFDDRLHQLVEAGESFKKIFDDHVTYCRRWRNAQLPLHRHLPKEIFIRIFKTAVAQEKGLETVNQLSAVCHFWKQLVDGTPSLWAGITATNHRDLVAKALTQSRTIPLDIKFDYDDEFTYDGFADDIAPHLARCRSVDLNLDEADEESLYIAHPAPLLESLDLRVERPVGDSPVIDASEAAMPRLRHLIVENVNIDIGLRSGLLTLNIIDIPDMGPSLTEIVELLQSNPGLEDLRLRSCFPSESSFPRDLPPMYLPHVKTLALAGLSDLNHSRLLAAMQTPGVRRFYTYTDDVSSTLLTPSLHRIRQVIGPVAGQKGRIRIVVGREGRTYRFDASRESLPGGDERDFNFRNMAYDISLTLQASMDPQLVKLTMDTLFRDLRDAEVSLEFDDEEAMKHWKIWLTAIPHVDRLRLYDYDGQVSVLQGLTSRGKDGWLCPTLTKIYIHLDDYRCLSAVLDLVKNRYRNRRDGVDVGPSNPLDLLVLYITHTSGIPDTALEEIERALGPEQAVVTRDPSYPWMRRENARMSMVEIINNAPLDRSAAVYSLPSGY